MGNRFSRRRDTPASTGETAATEQKAAQEPAAPPPAAAAAEESGITQTQEATTENLDVVVGEPVTPVASLPTEPCVAESKEVEAPDASAAPNDAAPESVAKEETPAPIQTEPLVSTSEPSPPESEPVTEPEPVAETQPTPEPASEPVPEPEPEAEAEAEAVPEPISEATIPVPAESPEQQIDTANHESLPEPELVSTPLVDLGVSDDAPQPVNTSPSDPDNADEPSDIPVTEECEGSIEAAESSTLEPEKLEETTESVEKPTEVEAVENLEQLASDVNEENISGLLQNLELKGNDLVADLIPGDVKIPDDTLVTDISTSTELM